MKNRDKYTVRMTATGQVSWRLNGIIHRGGDRPAIMYKNGAEYYYQNGYLHRENGPAVAWPSGKTHHFIFGVETATNYQSDGRESRPC